MSDHVIDLLNNDDEIELKPQVVYSPKVTSAVMVSWTNNLSGLVKHHAIDVSRYLSSIWQFHSSGYRYTKIRDVTITQRIEDNTILKGELSLDIVYRDGQFTVNSAAFNNVDFESTEPFLMVTYEPVTDAIVESITVDNTHVLATGDKAPEPKIPSKETPDLLKTVVVHGPLGDQEPAHQFFHVPPHRGTLRRVSDGSFALELDNVRLEAPYPPDEDHNQRKVEIGVTGIITFVNSEAVVPEIKLVNPRIFVLKDGEWKRSERRAEFIGYVTNLIFDKDREVVLDMPANYELHPYVWLEGMNHHPEHMGHWVPFNGWRMKDRYDLRLHNGEEHKYYYPNACAWAKMMEHDGPSRIEDTEVAFVRQVPDEECTEKYFFSGQERIKRNLSSFGDALPDVYVLPDGSVQFKIRHRRLFRESQIIADISPDDFFRHQSTILGHDEHTLTEVLHVPFTVHDPLFKSAVRYLKGLLEDKQYSGFTLVEDARHGYVGCLNGNNYADTEVDWVLRQLIPIAQALPKKPEEEKPMFVDPFRSGNGIGHIDLKAGATGMASKNNRTYNPKAFEPKRPKNNKALKKAAKKERVRALKEAKVDQA